MWGDDVSGPEVGGEYFRLATAVRESSTRSSTRALGGLRLELLLLRAGVQEGHLAAQC